MRKQARTPHPAPPAAVSDEQLGRAAQGSGLTVEELRRVLEQHPMTEAELEDCELFAERVRQGTEKLTYLKR